MADSVYWIWFQLVFGIGTRRSELMLNYRPDPSAIHRELEQGGKVKDMLEPIERERAQSAMEQAETILARTLKKGCAVVTPDDAVYPPLLREIYARPAALYVKGDISCLSDALCIAVVGPRQPSEYGIRAAKYMAGELASAGATIVSGLANGVDSAAHQAALDAGGKTVGFLGCGMDIDYPKGSAALKRAVSENGAVVTEYPLGTAIRPGQFPVRNRVIAGVSHGVLVAEASKTSGALITARHAFEQGREVFAVPGSIFSPLQQGIAQLHREDVARLVTSPIEIIQEYGHIVQIAAPAHKSRVDGTAQEEEAHPSPSPTEAEPKPPRKRQLPAGVSDEAGILYELFEGEPLTAQDIAVRSGLETSRVLAALTELELYGMIQLFPGRIFGLRDEA